MSSLLKRITPPALEPVDLAEIKAHLRLEQDAEDGLLQHLLVAARDYVQEHLNRALITQDWQMDVSRRAASGEIRLPYAPFQLLLAVHYVDAAGEVTEAAPDDWRLDPATEPARLVLSAPFSPVRISFRAGYGDAADDVPAPIRLALLQLVAHWYEHREAVAGVDAVRLLPFGVAALLAPYRLVRL